jgi:hypothetical protein
MGPPDESLGKKAFNEALSSISKQLTATAARGCRERKRFQNEMLTQTPDLDVYKNISSSLYCANL